MRVSSLRYSRMPSLLTRFIALKNISKKVIIMSDKLQVRRNLILKALAQIPVCTIRHLSEITKVSTETVRKDLDFLANEGVIIKVHGGAALANSTGTIPFGERAVRHAKEKKLIVKSALPLIAPGDTIILESCTTNLELAKLLLLNPELLKSLIIITNSFPITELFENGNKCRGLFFLGGWASAGQRNTYGYQTSLMLKEFHIGKSFLSGAALSSKNILSAYYENDALFQKSAINAADKTVLMIDHSKFEKTGVFSVADLSEIDYLISDKPLTSDEQSEMETRYNLHWIHAF